MLVPGASNFTAINDWIGGNTFTTAAKAFILSGLMSQEQVSIASALPEQVISGPNTLKAYTISTMGARPPSQQFQLAVNVSTSDCV